MGKEESGLRKILIVEDDKVLNKTLAYNLTADGYEVTSAYSFLDAVERLKKSEFDIALLDINLPDGNGLHHALQIMVAVRPLSQNVQR